MRRVVDAAAVRLQGNGEGLAEAAWISHSDIHANGPILWDDGRGTDGRHRYIVLGEPHSHYSRSRVVGAIRFARDDRGVRREGIVTGLQAGGVPAEGQRRGGAGCQGGLLRRAADRATAGRQRDGEGFTGRAPVCHPYGYPH